MTVMRTTAEIEIRALREEDYPALVGIRNANFPDEPTSLDEFRYEVQRLDRARYTSEWLVAVDREAREPVGYGSLRHSPWSFHPRRFRVGVIVHPDRQGRGVGRRLMDAIMKELRHRGAERAGTWAREDRARSVTFLRRAGFAEISRDFASLLDVPGVDLSRFSRSVDHMARRGVTITTLAEELAQSPACLPAVYQAHMIMDMEAPRDDPEELPTPVAYDDFLKEEVHHPRALLDAFFLAKVGDLYIGESAMKLSDADAGLLHQQLTGVLGLYRGLGVATALKVRTVEYAQRRGYRTIRTMNSSRNEAMLAINAKFGFVRQPAWIGFVKTLP